jgi:hypothetical protein
MKKLSTWYWAVVLLALPLFLRVHGVTFVETAKMIAFVGLALTGLAIFGCSWTKYDWWIPAIIIVGFFNMRNQGTTATYVQYTCMALGLLLIPIARKACGSPGQRSVIKMVIGAVCIISSISIIMNDYGLHIYEFYVSSSNGSTHIRGLLSNRMQTAGLIAISAPALFSFPWLLPIAIYALWLCQSALGAVAFTFSVIAWVVFRKRQKLVKISFPFMIAASIIAILYGALPYSGFLGEGGRVGQWWKALNLMPGSELFGNGVGFWSDWALIHKDREWFRQLHSDWLELVFGFGLFGVVCLIGAFYRIFTKNCDFMAICGLMALGICAIGSFPMHLSPIVVVCLTWYAIAENTLSED